MNSLVHEITSNFDFNIINMNNPTLLNNNNYFSKISQDSTQKNFYIQLPKCLTKQGIVKNNTRNFSELLFNSNDKTVIEFFENLENYCVEQIIKNKEIWFYESDNMSNDDIQELLTPIMRSYKSGKFFTIKCNVKNDKLIIYDENEHKLNLEDFNNNYEIIPLLNINGIKFSSKNFVIDIILVQFMVLYPADTYENQLLIKLNKKNNEIKIPNTESNTELNTELNTESDTNTESVVEAELGVEAEPGVEPESRVDLNTESGTNAELEAELEAEPELEPEPESNKKEFKYLFDSNLDKVSCNDGILEIDELDNLVTNTEPIELKTHETIYLEIYKKAKQKAKEIRKNAIEAFLEAKNIKAKYNLDSLLENDSSDDDENSFLQIE